LLEDDGNSSESSSVLNIPQEGSEFEDGSGRQPGQIGNPSAKTKTAAEMLTNSVGVIGIALCGEEAEPKKHHKESMQEGFEDYMTAKGWDSVPPWIGLAVALGAYVVFCLMTPRGKEFTQKVFNKGKKALGKETPAPTQSQAVQDQVQNNEQRPYYPAQPPIVSQVNFGSTFQGNGGLR